MKHVVMGTAGHIDHGKTTLVKRLTGIDTDRLEEEKRRGMTIELGFAPLILPSGNVVSIIDVPGHEKFVKTMVAGATGIDFAMLVIAADEGVMPQTVEHLEILSILGVSAGVVALTKAELADQEWIETVRDEVTELLEGTTLEGIRIIPVSSLTGLGMEELLHELERLTAEASGYEPQSLFRLPVDRIFTMTGHGTIVTGTVRGGSVRKGDTLEVLPGGRRVKVRGIQVHNKIVETAEAGDRCALNITGVEKSEIIRGDVIAFPDTIKPVSLIDAVVMTVKGRDGISHNQRVHFHIGTQEVLARIRVLGQNGIAENSRGYVQVRLESPVIAVRGDKFILRSYSPVATLGGGSVIFHETSGRKRFAEETAAAMKIGEFGTIAEIVRLILAGNEVPMDLEEIWRKIYCDRSKLNNALLENVSAGYICHLEGTDKFIDADVMQRYGAEIGLEFSKLYEKYPFRFRIDREQIKSRVFPALDMKDFAAIMSLMARNELYKVRDSYVMEYSDATYERILMDSDTQKVERLIESEAFALRNPEFLAQDLKMDLQRLGEVEHFLISAGRIINLGDNQMVHNTHLKAAVMKLREIMDRQGCITAGEARDQLAVSRKAAIALLEHLDEAGVTIREENKRKPGIRYLDLYI